MQKETVFPRIILKRLIGGDVQLIKETSTHNSTSVCPTSTARGFPKIYSKAIEWYRRAADQGHVEAQAALGELYGQGKGVVQDYSKAAVWLRRAADQGHKYAQFRLGYLYVEGAGVPQDFSKAIDWYRRAADQGHPSAQFNLGVLYITGKGVARDYVAAYTFISLAVANGLAGVGEARDHLAERMTAEQIAEAQRRVREWKRKPSPDGQ